MSDPRPPQLDHDTHPDTAESSSFTSPAQYNLSPEQMENLITKELQSLSFHDRNAIQEEIHGVRNVLPDETPERVHDELERLAQELYAIPMQQKAAFSQAMMLPLSYVHDQGFRIKFLRADLWNPKEAAKRIVSFLDMMLDFFGPDLLMRPVRLSDLSEQEMRVLKSGQIQLLPFRDRSGRRIIAFVSGMGFEFDLRAKFKAISYLLWVANEDEETQKKGMVVLMWPGEDAAHTFLRVPDPNEGKGFDRMKRSAPCRAVAAHICFPDTQIFQLFKAFLMFWSGTSYRSRTRFYSGTNLETRYQLMGFGIPVDHIPLTDSGSVKTKPIVQWLKIRRAIEDASPSMGIVVECPLSLDVLFKSGSNCLSHPGNVMFRTLIENNYQEHNSTKSSGLKVALSWKIVDEVVMAHGGRFLEWDKRGWWSVITDRSQMRAKVATSLRDFKKQVEAFKNRQTSMSSTYDFERQDGRKRKRTDFNGSERACFRSFDS